jgi:hypothetical protein
MILNPGRQIKILQFVVPPEQLNLVFINTKCDLACRKMPE